MGKQNGDGVNALDLNRRLSTYSHSMNIKKDIIDRDKQHCSGM